MLLSCLSWPLEARLNSYCHVVANQVAENTSVAQVGELPQVFKVEFEGSWVLVEYLVDSIQKLDENRTSLFFILVSDAISDGKLVAKVHPIFFNQHSHAVHRSEVRVDDYLDYGGNLGSAVPSVRAVDERGQPIHHGLNYFVAHHQNSAQGGGPIRGGEILGELIIFEPKKLALKLLRTK